MRHTGLPVPLIRRCRHVTLEYVETGIDAVLRFAERPQGVKSSLHFTALNRGQKNQSTPLRCMKVGHARTRRPEFAI